MPGRCGRRDDCRLLREGARVYLQPAPGLTARTLNRSLIRHLHKANAMGSMNDTSAIRHAFQHLPDRTVDGESLSRFLVVIDHRHANIYTSTNSGSVPVVVTPAESDGDARHLHHARDTAGGPRRPGVRRFYKEVIAAIENARSILVFGSSNGGDGAMVHLMAELETHHPKIAARVVGNRLLDQQHLTEDQMLAAAREYYASPRLAAIDLAPATPSALAPTPTPALPPSDPP